MIETLLPIQNLHRRSSPVDPHRRLMVAVLQTVLDDCCGSIYRRARGYPVPAGRDVCDAGDYLASGDRQWPFSFENLCEALGLNADSVRERLLAAARRRSTRVSVGRADRCPVGIRSRNA